MSPSAWGVNQALLYVSTVSLALTVLIVSEAGFFNTVVTLAVVAFLAWRIIYQRCDKQSVMHELSRELDGLELGWMDEKRQAWVCRLSECYAMMSTHTAPTLAIPWWVEWANIAVLQPIDTKEKAVW